ncbi:hypothetical protein ACSBR2_033670 [Camellia fascicularis]
MELPNHSELSPRLLGFLDHHFVPTLHHNQCSSSSVFSLSLSYNTACDLEANLSTECAQLDAHLQHLHQNLAKLIISWISRSIAAKSTLHKLNLTTMSPYGIQNQKMLTQDLPQFAMELNRLENIRSYADTTLQLEAMVGDLEDAVFSVVNKKSGSVLSANCSNPSVSKDQGSREEKFFQAVRSMNFIEDLLVSPVKFRPQWCHLMKSVDSRVDKTLTLLRRQVLADHRALLSSLGWPPKVFTSKIESGKISILPNPLLLMQVDKQKAYSESFLELCALQHLQTRREKRQLGLLGKKKLNTGLWAIDELASPIASRSEYHFSKWVDQPEFIFALVSKITKDFMGGVDDVLQPLIDRAKLVSLSAKEAWISVMVQALSSFLAKRVFCVLVKRYKEKKEKSEMISSWLHLIDLMVNFDKQMMSLVSSEAYLFTEDSEMLEGSSRGLSVFSLFSDRPDWLKIWAKIELKVGRMKLKEESKHERAWFVDMKKEIGSAVDTTTERFLLYTREDHKAPLIVEFALKLGWEMIERCKTLPGILARAQFIRSTAAKLLLYLLKLLLLQYKGVEFLSTDCNDGSLLKLCAVINGARYCESKLQEWSDDVDFLEMRIAEIDKNISVKDDMNDNSLFFGEEIKSLAELETHLLMEIIADLLHQFETLTEEYVQNKDCFEQEEEDDGLHRASKVMDFSVSIDIMEALDTLRSQLCIINASLNPKDFSDLWRSVADGLDRFIFGCIFTSDYRFSEKGTSQFGADMRALFVVFQPFCTKPEAFFPFVRNSLKLLEMDRRDLGHLNFCSVTHLSFDQAEKILRNRKF